MKSTKNKTTIKQAAEILKNSDDIALFSHIRPDGDTVGAAVALCLALKKMGKKASLFCNDQLSDGLRKFDKTALYSDVLSGKFRLMVAVDCGDLFRLGEFATAYDRCAETMTIDHHGGEFFSKYNCLAHYASTCQMIYEILQLLPVETDEEIATYLYMGLCTDTGNFANSSTDSASLYMAGDLLNKGADFLKVNRVFFTDTTFEATRLHGRAMSRMRSYCDGKLMVIFITGQDLEEFNLPANVSEGIVQYAISVETAVAGVSLCEYSPNSFKVSMRGKDFNVRDICRQFGGNGHLVAAGCMINGLLEDVIERIVRAVSIALEQA